MYFKFGRKPLVDFNNVRVGDIFYYNGDTIKCVESIICLDIDDNECIFHIEDGCGHGGLDCTSGRFDGKSVMFKKIN